MASRRDSPSRVKPSADHDDRDGRPERQPGMRVDDVLRLAEHLAPFGLRRRPASRARGRTAPPRRGSRWRPPGWPARSPGTSSWAACAGRRSALRLTPSARAASTWSDSRWASICPRSSRANTGICAIDTAMITRGQVGVGEQHADRDGQQQAGDRQHDVDDPHDDGVHPAAEGAGQRCPGSGRRSARSAWPGRRPAGSAGLPTIMRENRSRPWVSPPSGKPALRRARSRCGPGRSGRSATARPGRAGRSSGPKIASSRNSPTITAPIQNSGDTFSRCQASSSSDGPSSSQLTRASMRCLRARR